MCDVLGENCEAESCSGRCFPGSAISDAAVAQPAPAPEPGITIKTVKFGSGLETRAAVLAVRGVDSRSINFYLINMVCFICFTAFGFLKVCVFNFFPLVMSAGI